MAKLSENVENIVKHDSVSELIDCILPASFWDDLDDDDKTFLRHFDDFEEYIYFCVNYDALIITESGGDVVAFYPCFSDFMEEITKLLEEDREER